MLGCTSAAVTTTLPLTVVDTGSLPQAGLPIYAFDGTNYTGYHGTTDSNGQAAFTLPQGTFLFRRDKAGTQFWSGTANHCAVPDCASATVALAPDNAVMLTSGY